jgi:hypothetical protein
MIDLGIVNLGIQELKINQFLNPSIPKFSDPIIPVFHYSLAQGCSGKNIRNPVTRVSDSPEFRCPHFSESRNPEAGLRKSETGTRK